MEAFSDTWCSSLSQSDHDEQWVRVTILVHEFSDTLKERCGLPALELDETAAHSVTTPAGADR